MAKLNTEFMNDDIGFFSKVEDDLENSIENYIDNYDGKEMPWNDMCREAFEQLFVSRGFLFAWYPFKKDSEILEIGGGVGSITGFLCSTASKVVTVEKKLNRVKIIEKRYKDLKNLMVIHDNYMNLSYSKKFDYIVIHDIFGYVKKYVKSEKPYETFLKQMKNMLKEDGIILLATENRLGIKYFSGAIEDYSNKYFVGLNNFDGYDVVYAPSKKELETLLAECGMTSYKFYYPFPDNIFPTEIFSDDSMRYLQYGGKSEEIGWDRYELFNEKEMFETLQREGIVQEFANSFLIEIGKEENQAKTTYCRLIDSKTDGSFDYISISGQEYVGLNKVSHRLEEGSISLQKKLNDLMYHVKQINISKKECSQQIVDSFRNVKYLLEKEGEQISNIYTDEFVNIFGNDKIKRIGMCNSFSEISTKNIFCSKGNYTVFLEENSCKVPVDYLIWLIIYEWYLNNVWERKSRMNIINLKQLYEVCNLDYDDIQVFQKWRNNYEEHLNKKWLKKHYANWYKQDFIYPVDAIVHGDLIMRDFMEKKTREDNQLLVEKDILDEVR